MAENPRRKPTEFAAILAIIARLPQIAKGQMANSELMISSPSEPRCQEELVLPDFQVTAEENATTSGGMRLHDTRTAGLWRT